MDGNETIERKEFFLFTPLGIAMICILVIFIGICIFFVFGRKNRGEGLEKAVGSEEIVEGEAIDESKEETADLAISEDLPDSEDCDESKDIPAQSDAETTEDPAHCPDVLS